jgi:ribulose-5-phosphate 4-epimerase/fuculose-1-phosphate aldolase
MGKSELIARPTHLSEAEWQVRLDLAACYQLFDFLGWTEGIYNHISARVPGPERHYLVNPFGLHYAEVTASNLLKVDLRGANVEPSAYQGNAAGFAIHGAIHGARVDAHCVIHTHTTAGMAIALKQEGLRHDDFYGAILAGQVAYHDFEGITVRGDEGERLVRSLGDCNVMILRNHGLLACGVDVPSAFATHWTLQRACEVQAGAAAIAGPNIVLAAAIHEQVARDRRAFDATGSVPRVFFDAMVRRMTMARARRYVDWRS